MIMVVSLALRHNKGCRTPTQQRSGDVHVCAIDVRPHDAKRSIVYERLVTAPGPTGL